MRPRTVVSVGATLFALATPAASLAQTSEHGSCAAFAERVSTLAQTLGPAFGATASGVASSAPGAFPAVVVHPEQDAFCAPRP